ncbi:nitroreductase [Streptomyces albiflavescens]|uniref:Nitroreductase n=1 Tax=Streptomyces albiflavescens TaxID=1623582 RepID=A0A917XRH6_9ACTN|nr:nitroreductase family protein [Streptomyces albiflavescens]GGN48496.1 nitroreductase [Streptomyces albiflavescens]
MPVPPLEITSVSALVADATAAPSMHNAQPWRFRFLRDSQTVQLRADLERAMPGTDPDRRALHLGCGAALLNLRVAAMRAGRRPDVQLLPDSTDQSLLAAVRLSDPVDAEAPDSLAELYPAIRRRHTSRWPFADTDIPADVQAALVDAAREEGAQLLFPSAWHVDLLEELVHDAEGRDAVDPGRMEDVARWTRIGADEADTAVEGIPEYAFGPRKRDGKAPVRDFAGRRAVADRGATAFERNPHLALLGTREDRPRDWLCAGQAMERVLLLATHHDLATSLTSHALEWPDLRGLARDPLSDMGHVQMVLRLGYGPQGPATPRRPVRDVLDVE